MAIAKKCDRCGALYEEYDDIECNGIPISKIHTSYMDDELNVKAKVYDLCQDCCLEFVRWMVDTGTEVREKIETRLFADGEELLTIKPNGEVEWKDQITLIDEKEDSHVFADGATVLNIKEDCPSDTICEHCEKFNGDGIEDTDGFDYYSCMFKNTLDLGKYGQYSSLDNQVDPDECTHFMCEKCLLRDEEVRDDET